MNEKNIEQLKARLIELGFDASVDIELRCRICFSPGEFELSHKEVAGADVMRYAVKVEKNDRDVYGLLFYQAYLRKELIVPADLIGLDMKMSGIDWHSIADNRFGSIDKKSITNAFELLKEMESLGSAGDVLKFKYWVDTSLENLIPNLTVLKSRFEITERFYLLDAAHSIPFIEAKRFLQSKWMEREIMASKKLLIKKSESPKSPGSGNGKLLTKNSRRSGRQGLLKK